MSKKLLICLVLLTVLPLAIVSWLGVSRLKSQQQLFEQDYQRLIEKNLHLYREQVNNEMVNLEKYLLGKLQTLHDSQTGFQTLPQREPLIRQVFSIDRYGVLQYPDSSGDISSQETFFLQRTRLLFKNLSFLETSKQRSDFVQSEKKRKFRKTQSEQSEYGWTQWYWEEGLHLLFWKKNRDRSIVGIEVERIALTAKIIASLPEEAQERGKYTIYDNQDRPVYQWSFANQEEYSKELVSINLFIPLSTWSIGFSASAVSISSALYNTQTIILYIVLGLFIIIFITVAIYFYRDSTRELQEAQQRVNFVNQVSHELKTPLTNIQLYSELLKEAFDEEDEYASQLDVILSESQRLSRMINNILTFSKKQRSTLSLHKSEASVDTILKDLLSQLKIALEKRGIKTIDCKFNADMPVLIDVDAVRQISANIIGNVEKYATSGGYLGIVTSQNERGVTIIISDKGPGIPEIHREKIFKPYHRIKNSLNEGVSGTGIGLTIARDLARMHGGDLCLQNMDNGCSFSCYLPDTSKE